MKIIADDKIPFLKGVLEPFADVEYYPGSKISKDHISNADALLIRTRTKCNKNLLEGTSVKFIATATIGFDHIDTQYCKEAGIKWTNAPGCNSSSVQQYIICALFHLALKHNFDLQDKTLGIIGVGNVGSKVLNMAEELGMRIVLNDPPRMRSEGLCGFISLNGIINEADILTFHVPLNHEGTDKTYHMVDSGFFNKLKREVFIINSSRGEIIETNALKNAIKSGLVRDAVIDVWENEPGIDTELLSLVEIGTSHIAGYSLDGKAKGTAMSVNALSKFFNLPYIDWYPSGLPPVPDNLITVNCNGKSTEHILAEAVSSTYNITDDSRVLKADPGLFENYRGNYPLRREYGAYKVKIINEEGNIREVLTKSGFSVI